MLKLHHEIRDPIHVFVRLDDDERKVLDSRPFQRLRHVHQLALSYLIYPGATHKRFEHSLGVMELAGRVFDTVTAREAVTDKILSMLPEIAHSDQKAYWRRVLRMAALCHDLGHLPFSHAAEDELLPDGWNHEKLSAALIFSEELQEIWQRVTPPLRPDDIVKLAVGPTKAGNRSFTNWEAILSEIIVGDAFGADRIDYLLRDSYHAGVAYGRFDHYRLVDTLRILPSPPTDKEGGSEEPSLGVEHGGLESAEALLLARYFMFSQVYFHWVRRIYDIHLKDFLKEWLSEGVFSIDLSEHLRMTDVEVTAALRKASENRDAIGHVSARRIMHHDHFKLLYRPSPEDLQTNPEAARAVHESAVQEFGVGHLKVDVVPPKGGSPDFPVKLRDGQVVSSLRLSPVLSQLPTAAVNFVFVAPEKLERAEKWLAGKREELIQPKEEVEEV